MTRASSVAYMLLYRSKVTHYISNLHAGVHIGKTYTFSLDPGYTYLTTALTAGVDVMEKVINYSVIGLDLGKLACIHALTGCVLEKYLSPAERKKHDLSLTCFTLIIMKV